MRISDWSSDVCSSDLGRKRPRQFFDILLNQFLEAEHDARAALRIHSGPTGLRSLRRFNRTIQISLGAKTHLSLNHAIVRIENVADTASAADGVACDEMFDVTHRSSFTCTFGTPIQAMTAAWHCLEFDDRKHAG